MTSINLSTWAARLEAIGGAVLRGGYFCDNLGLSFRPWLPAAQLRFLLPLR